MVRTALVMTWLLTHHIHQEACTGGNCRPLLDERPTSSSTLVRSSDTGTRPSARPWRLSKQHVSPARRRARSRVWPRRRVRLVAGPRSSVVAGATADGRDCAQKRERATLPHWRRAGAARGRRRRHEHMPAHCPDRQRLLNSSRHHGLFWCLGCPLRRRLPCCSLRCLRGFGPFQRPSFLRGGDDRFSASRREPSFGL